MKVALLAVGAFSEEKLEAITKEVQANLTHFLIGPKISLWRSLMFMFYLMHLMFQIATTFIDYFSFIFH